MMRDYHREMYAVLTEAATKSKAVDAAALLWDVAVPAGELVKADDLRATNLKMMLTRVLRRVEKAKSVDDLKETVEQAWGLLSRMSRPEDILR